jgi:hypothetical protein
MPDSVNVTPINGLATDNLNNLHVIDYPQDAVIRYICTVNLEEVNDYSVPSLRSELDSHADTCVVGQSYLKVEDSMRLVSVCGCKGAGDRAKVPIVTAATVYYDEQSKTDYCLVFHEVLWYGDSIKTALLTPNQLRANQVEVLDIPLQYGGTSHSLYIAAHNLRIPLT